MIFIHEQPDELHTNTNRKSHAGRSMNQFLFWSFLLVGFAIVLCLLIPLPITALFAPYPGRNAAQRATSRNNLKQIALALHYYHEENQTFPAGGTITADGQPGHSWQTLILPYIDQRALFDQIDLGQPWNTTENQPAFRTVLPAYLNPVIRVFYPELDEARSPDGYALSHYVGNERVLKQNQGMPIREIRDGMSFTIFTMETGEEFKPWGDPTNIADPVEVLAPDKKPSQKEGHYILMGDGAVRFLSQDVDPRILQGLSTPDQGEEVREFLDQSSK